MVLIFIILINFSHFTHRSTKLSPRTCSASSSFTQFSWLASPKASSSSSWPVNVPVKRIKRLARTTRMMTRTTFWAAHSRHCSACSSWPRASTKHFTVTWAHVKSQQCPPLGKWGNEGILWKFWNPKDNLLHLRGVRQPDAVQPADCDDDAHLRDDFCNAEGVEASGLIFEI